ncbi:HAD-superfamily hydrolase [Formosa agariphila KMM 3901]|uniref:HAD-superfamily hydrolase n=1 Tax=Formosa agariphila (strain DSM 15362 / KCTC 12365 / LMG 23005 / KMM 3901 / M-2Alg 35-1) TaxID=1347342 RepID=T2KKR2_FORAG|nr:HAD family phosphatase [Formosa agariphila]CDF79033.1 HAD-superfamily hydrolase [Formosa agariphila KMM 3901]
MLKAVLFDMDGVIVNTEPLHYKAYYDMFKTVNVEVPLELYQSYTGRSTISTCRGICEHFGLQNAPEELVQLKRKAFQKLFKNDPDLDLLPGVLDLIKNYYNNGITLVLASSASQITIHDVFTRFELDQYFKGRISGADLEASKPHPEIFERAAEIAGFAPSECMVIEDSTSGIKASHTAGIYCVAYKSPHSKNQDYTLANKLISDFNEIKFERIKSEFEN